MPFINPSTLNFHPPSPAPSSSYTHDDGEHDEQPSRKRQRTSKDTASASSPSAAGSDAQQPLSLSDQRKEARAHRNRIAAQNSRDRRKAQFGYLEARVAELEAENRALRAGIMPVVAHQAPAPAPAPPTVQEPLTAYASLAVALEDRLRTERELARERENQELRERIRTLEQGWEAVVKALTAQDKHGVLPLARTVPAHILRGARSVITPVVNIPVNIDHNPGSTASRRYVRTNTQRTRRSRDHSPSSTDGDHREAFIGSLGVPAAGGSQDVFGVNRVPGSVAGLFPSAGAATNNNTNNNNNNGRASVPTSASAQKPEALLTIGGGASAPANNGDAAMEALFREILASPRAGQAVVPAAVRTPAVVSSSEEKQEEKREEETNEEESEGEESKTDDDGRETTTTTEQEQHEREVAEWATEIEVQRLLEFGGAYGDLSLPTSMGFDMAGIDMDMGSIGINMPGDLGLDMSGFESVAMEMDMEMGGFDFGLGGVSPEMDLLGMYAAAPASTAT